jgi:DNA-binding NarL/FixJ family response regulator
MALTWDPNEKTEDKLTRREVQVLALLAKGLRTKQIAAVLSLSPNTIDLYRGHILAKLRVHNSASAVRAGIERGIIEV